MINTSDLGLNKENLVCGRLESSVVALETTTTTVSESHVVRGGSALGGGDVVD